MMIYYKLLLPFLIFSLLIFHVGYIAVGIGKKALEEDIGKNTVYLADEIMEKLVDELDRSIENFEEYGRDLLLSEYLQKSNKEFREARRRETIYRIEREVMEGPFRKRG